MIKSFYRNYNITLLVLFFVSICVYYCKQKYKRWLSIFILSNQEVTTEEPLTLLNQCNEDGHTPLHIACHNDQPDCVQALLCAGEIFRAG